MMLILVRVRLLVRLRVHVHLRVRLRVLVRPLSLRRGYPSRSSRGRLSADRQKTFERRNWRGEVKRFSPAWRS